MTNSIPSPQTKEVAAIFLDIDGVFLGDVEDESIALQIEEKLTELFGEKPHYTELEERVARSYFFSEEALDWFNVLVEKVSAVAEVIIILSSSWRQHGSLEEIQTSMFPNRNFSKLIVDKTVHDDSWRIHQGEEPLFAHFHTDPRFLWNERSIQIDSWLRENRETYKIATFAIIDDCNLGFTEIFPNNFVHITGTLFSKEHAKQVYKILTSRV